MLKNFSLTIAYLLLLSVLACASPAMADTGLEMPGNMRAPDITLLPGYQAPVDIAGNWAEEDIKEMLGIKAISAYPDNTIRPDKAVTRAELASALANGLNLPPGKEVEMPDVSSSHWAYQSILNALPYMAVYTDGSFRPNAVVTREDLAAATVRATGLNRKAVDPAGIAVIFKDYRSVSPGLLHLVAVAVDQKLLKGYKVYEPGGSYKDAGGDYNLYIRARYPVTMAEMCNMLNTARKGC
ncbi:hypothetical protein DCCM_0825 [Desulfocucumis palustris]|uniref:SLH domain-containing protein n=1 Tax=Desulfocucumis palustris TaxID=1898651 RepID=A0A2L2X8T3_9FIRM|nr:S-layer homology domain-containing protein [Desulfocucumis palustris]GBF32629.1 hypothetical protein DCCM_0825 [Desulfocucumis palustris]